MNDIFDTLFDTEYRGQKQILCLIPVKKNLPHALQLKTFILAKTLQTVNGNYIEIVFDETGDGDSHIKTFEERAKHNGIIRQILIEKYLQSRHTHVLWIDSDIFYNPTTIVKNLLNLTKDGIGAPAIYLEDHGKRWYDTKGFIENNKETPIHPPFFKQSGPIINLDSVGAFYMVHSDIYRTGVKHTDYTIATEHWPICQKAISIGRNVRCDLRITVTHAYLPKYGENSH